MLALSFEFNFGMGQTSSFLIPIIGNLPEPIPLLTYVTFCLMGIYAFIKIGPKKQMVNKMSESNHTSLLSMIKEDQFDNSDTIKGNLSNIINADTLLKKEILKKWKMEVYKNH